MVAQDWIEVYGMQVDHFIRMARIAQAGDEPLQNRVAKRPRVVVGINRENFHGVLLKVPS
jgi:hypothetical protein